MPATDGQPWNLYVGDARTVLAAMPDQSANCIVTSPPYWGKRDYGVAGQYGHEDTPAAYVDTMRDVFREARRPRDMLAEPRRLILRQRGRRDGDGMPTSASTSPPTALPASTRSTCSASRGGSRSLSRATAGFCGTRSSGISPTRCPNRSATGFRAGTSCCSCSSSSPATGSTWTRSAYPTRRIQREERCCTARRVRAGSRLRRPTKYGPGTASGHRGQPVRHPCDTTSLRHPATRPQPWRCVVSAHPPLPRSALRRLSH